MPTVSTTTLLPAPPGIVYWLPDRGEIWQVGASGQPTTTINWGPPALSSDGRYQYLAPAHYPYDVDFQVFDHQTGQQINIVADSDRQNFEPQWWPSKPDVIIFKSWPPPGAMGPDGGELTAVNIDGSNYRLLGVDFVLENFALDPTGQMIAYSVGQPMLYLWEQSAIVPLIQADYDVPENITSFFEPAWSPAGTKIAWAVIQDAEPESGFGIIIIDLEAKIHHLSRLFTIAPYWIGNTQVQWSPDGRWLSFIAWTDNPDEYGLWIIDANGEAVFFLHESSPAFWSPDGKQFVAQYEGPMFLPPDKPPVAWLVDAESWQVSPIDLPADAQILTWVSLTP